MPDSCRVSGGALTSLPRTTSSKWSSKPRLAELTGGAAKSFTPSQGVKIRVKYPSHEMGISNDLLRPGKGSALSQTHLRSVKTTVTEIFQGLPLKTGENLLQSRNASPHTRGIGWSYRARKW